MKSSGKERSKAWYHAHKKEQKEKAHKYYLANKESIKERTKLWWKNNPEWVKNYENKRYKSLERWFNAYKSGAKSRKINFRLSKEEFSKIIQEPCFYCGILANPRNGIDRKNNKEGYELLNCVACCSLCNRMKYILSSEEFINKCIEIVKNRSRLN